ncbi:MAG: DAK2 domain-containing protein, partial [Microbacterium sp.]
MNELDGRAVLAWVLGFADAFSASASAFAAWDRAMGDGDFAENIGGGLALAVPRLRALPDPAPGDVLSTLGETFLDEVGGTSGPLFGLMFQSLGRAAGDAAGLDGAHVAHGLD